MDNQDHPQNEKNKEENESDTLPLLSFTLSNFKHIDNNPDYIKLVNQLTIFKQLKKNQIYYKTEIPFDDIQTKLYEDLEKSLTEAVLLNNPKVRNEHLRKLNYWFNHTLNYFESLIRIKERTTKDLNQLIEAEPLELEEELSHEKMNKHRDNIEGFEAPNIRLKEFERKEVSIPVNIRQMNVTESSVFRKTGEKFKRINSGKSTNIKSTCYATQTGSKFFKPNPYVTIVKNCDQRMTNAWINPSKEVKSSYSYMRPDYKYAHLILEKEVNGNKMKIIAEKRQMDEVNEGIQEFAYKRAAYTQTVNQRHEMKDLIKKYRVIVSLNLQKEEEEKIKLAKEKKLKEMIEKENERKRLHELEEIKRKEEEEKEKKKKEYIDIIGKQKSNFNSDTYINENEEVEDNENEQQGDENQNDEEEEEEQDNREYQGGGENELGNENDNQIQFETTQLLKEKVTANNPRFIFSSITCLNELVINYQCKINRNTIRIRNNQEMLQRNIIARENVLLETNQHIQIPLPSDVITYANTTNRVFNLRTFNSKLINVNQIDSSKDGYQKSLCPLSKYDQVHMLKTEPPMSSKLNSNTFSFLYDSYQKNSNDYLNFRQTLSNFRSKYNILQKKGLKHKKGIKIQLTNLNDPYKEKSNTPMTYLPIPSTSLLHLP